MRSLFLFGLLALTSSTVKAEVRPSPSNPVPQISMESLMPVAFGQVMKIGLREFTVNGQPMIVLDMIGTSSAFATPNLNMVHLQTKMIKANDVVLMRCLTNAEKLLGGYVPPSRAQISAAEASLLDLTMHGNGQMVHTGNTVEYLNYDLVGCDVSRTIR